MSDLLDNPSSYSDMGNLYVLYADLDLRVNEDPSKALELLDKAQQLGGLDLVVFYETRGHARWMAGDKEEGIRDLENSIALRPDVETMSHLGRLLSSDRDKRAVAIWKQVLEKDPDHCSAQTFLGMEAARVGDREQALQMAESAKSLVVSADEYFELARLYEYLDMFADAAGAYLKAGEKGYEDEEELYSRIATCHTAKGDMDVAKQYIIKAVKLGMTDDYTKDMLLWIVATEGSDLTPDDLPGKYQDACISFILLAWAAIKQKDYVKAYKLVSKAEQLDPSPAEIYHIGLVYHQLCDWGKSLLTFLECRRLGYPEHSALYAIIGNCYSNLDHPKEAMRYALKSLDIDATDDSAKAVLLWAIEETESDPAVEKVFEERPDTCLAALLVAHKAILEKDFPKAAEMTARAEQFEPSAAEIYGIGQLYHRINNIQKALRLYAECEKIDYEYKSQLHGSIADCYYSLGNYDTAIRYAVKALCEYPTHEYAANVLLNCRKAVWGSRFGDNY